MHWTTKEFGNLVGVSVRTLHHYDQIDLLKPSARASNGYRLYSQSDLMTLQQIMALKFFGFTLGQIKSLLDQSVDAKKHLTLQAELLEIRAQELLLACKNLKEIVSCGEVTPSSIPWKKMIEIMKVYKMTQNIENKRVYEFLSQDELEDYARFEAGLKERYTPKEKEDFHRSWGQVAQDVNDHINQDPGSSKGTEIAERCMSLVNGLYGEKHADLKRAVWEKGFKKGYEGQGQDLSPEAVAWLDQAIGHFYKERIFTLLDQVGQISDEKMKEKWDHLMSEMYGASCEPGAVR